MKIHYFTTVLILFSVLHVTCQINPAADQKEEVKIQLLRDAGFQKGFIQRGNTASDVKHIPIQTDSETDPVWILSQWYSDYVLTKNDLHIFSDKNYTIENEANRIKVACEEDEVPVISIFSSGKMEWAGDTVRKPGDAWPHLLLSQDIENCPLLNEVKSIHFKADVRVKNWKINFPELYQSKIHAARFRLNFIVRNVNKNSEGYNDYFWFVMTFFDNRHLFMPETGKLDEGSEKKKASGKYIYGTDAKLYLDKSLHELEWVSIDFDILPLIKDGLIQAQKGGYLPESDGLEDYVIRAFNFGYELTANIDIESQVKNLSTSAIIER
jgi:hypothetical protein